jgi:BolA family transcriptional regulator, general stress-responsive regulator
MAAADIIKSRLQTCFSPEYLEVINDSHKHAGHSGSPGTGQSHFTVIISSKSLNSLSRIEAYRSIHECLKSEMSDFIHALSIQLK